MMTVPSTMETGGIIVTISSVVLSFAVSLYSVRKTIGQII
jgi:hypothetical protein